jgi:LTXXQ motif family protein
MNLRSSRSALLALGIGAALTAGLIPVVSSAQAPPQQLPAPPQPNRAAPPTDRGDARGYDRRAGRFEDRLERRLDFLHSELRITPAQEQAWTAFADAVRREDAQGRDQIRDRRDSFRGGPDGRSERPGIVERLERRQQGLEERSSYYDRLLGALRPLYAMLSEDQRRAADENLFSPGRDDRGRRGGPRRYGMNRDFGRGFYRPFERPYGPFDPPYDSVDRDYR